MNEIPVGDRPINLTQVLKRIGWVDNGGQAKALIAEGLVRVNGEVEFRKRRQMVVGDSVQLDIDEPPPPIRLV
ncbi:RNA-binding S4 domain-containing protein [Tautonia rosea]|uniref:RNA-binding S4 domain-containing protein n=1 Tax=Tautonia rosea TaxID=2728037 RepID=UPI00147473F5|nr:RNA-binding S4 domain-containing protein [Tautonia rosea]